MKRSMYLALTASSVIATLSAFTFSPSALAQLSVFEAPTAGAGLSFSQLGSTQAYVPMEHELEVINGNEVLTHVLATESGNLNMKGKIGMRCPAGRTVTYLAYRPQGQQRTVVVDGDTHQTDYDRTITMQPFSLEDLETAGQAALGGSWVGNNPHPNTPETVKKALHKSVQVWGQCSGLAAETQAFPVTLSITFEDKDYPPSPAG